MKTFIWFISTLFLTGLVLAEEPEQPELNPSNLPADMGRTFFDDEEQIVKEVYSYKEVQRFNPERPEEGITFEEVKDGQYFRYYENGRLEVMGTYSDGEKNGKFRYFDEEGNELESIIYNNGQKVE